MIRYLAFGAAALLLAACGNDDTATDASADASGHNDAHVASFKSQCLDEAGHEAFCECGIDALHTHLPPEHVDVGEDGTASISMEAPDDVHDAVSDAAFACEQEHLNEVRDQQADEAVDHLAYFRNECVLHTGHNDYCDCSIAALKEVLPHEHVEKEGAHAGISPDAPEDVISAISSALNECEVQHPLDQS